MISTARERLLVNAQGVTEMQTYWPKALHEGTWGGWFSGLVNLLAGVLLFALSLTGFLSWLRRQRGAKRQILTEGAEVLVLHASQTGTAQGLAEATSAALTGAGHRRRLRCPGAHGALSVGPLQEYFADRLHHRRG